MQFWLVSVLIVMMVLSGCWLLVHAEPRPSPPATQPIVSSEYLPQQQGGTPVPSTTPPTPVVSDTPKLKTRRSTTQMFSGTITTINVPGQQLVVKNSQGTVQSFFLDPRTKLSQGRHKATLAEFSTGQQVRIRYRSGTNGLSVTSSVRLATHKAPRKRKTSYQRRTPHGRRHPTRADRPKVSLHTAP